MKKIITMTLLMMATGLSAQESGETLVQTMRCYSCHHESNALIGPAYIAIAARHSSRKEVMVDVLAEKIRLGGGGNWGIVPMVPNEHVSENNARIIADWILRLND